MEAQLEVLQEISGKLSEISSKLDSINETTYAINDIAQKIDEAAYRIMGDTSYNLTDIFKVLSEINSTIFDIWNEK